MAQSPDGCAKYGRDLYFCVKADGDDIKWVKVLSIDEFEKYWTKQEFEAAWDEAVEHELQDTAQWENYLTEKLSAEYMSKEDAAAILEQCSELSAKWEDLRTETEEAQLNVENWKSQQQERVDSFMRGINALIETTVRRPTADYR